MATVKIMKRIIEFESHPDYEHKDDDYDDAVKAALQKYPDGEIVGSHLEWEDVILPQQPNSLQ